jgi:hypothetical protein
MFSRCSGDGSNTGKVIGASELSTEQVNELLELCKSKIDEFEAKRGDTVWQHRKRGHRPISGSVRYEVLSWSLINEIIRTIHQSGGCNTRVEVVFANRQ